MKIDNVHERRVDASPDEVAAVFANLNRLWPAPAPRPENGSLRMGLMLWRPLDRPGSPAAFRFADPDELRGEHWFEIADGGAGETILRHTVEGEAVGEFEEIWRDRVEPMHDAYIEALFDRAEEALAR